MRHAHAVRALALLVTLVSSLAACGGSVEVTRSYSPADAARASGPKLTAVAVVREKSRIAIPAGAKVEPDRIVLGAGLHVHKLGPNDVIVTDTDGRIVSVRTPGTPPIVTQFVPGTASSPEGSDEVRGQLAGGAPAIPLLASDRIEMHGQFETDEKVPGGGVVETRRSTGGIVGGVLLLAAAYAPSAYVGASSSLKADRVLLVPVVGPWIDYGTRPKCQPPQLPPGAVLPVDPCIGETAAKVALIVSGVVQGFGALILTIALPSTTEVVYERDRATARRTKRTERFVRVVPTGTGAAVVGTF